MCDYILLDAGDHKGQPLIILERGVEEERKKN